MDLGSESERSQDEEDEEEEAGLHVLPGIRNIALQVGSGCEQYLA